MKAEYEPLSQEREGAPSHAKIIRSSRTWRAVISSLLLGAFAAAATRAIYQSRSRSMPKTVEGEKYGSGFLFLHEDQVLLLLRNSQHNDKTWGLPGGNAEQADLDLLDTARREGTEELGSVPEFEVLAEIETRRGKKQQKHYTVFVARLGQSFQPVLNSEHSEFRWVSAVDVSSLGKLHPVVDLLFADPHVQQLAETLNMDPELLRVRNKPKKLGAGLFFVAGGEALLLTRNSSHNNATLSVPGGNVDLGEKKLRQTAEREAVEEMGSCPEYVYKGEIDTRRGKHMDKEFKIFLAEVSPVTKASFRATLDHESLGWGWYPLDSLSSQALHPVVEILVMQHMSEIKAAFGLN